MRHSWEPDVPGLPADPPCRAARADRFFIVNGDTLSGVSLAGLADAHMASRAGSPWRWRRLICR
jgi:hypothetical protein